MLNVLLILNVIVAVLGGRALFRRTRNYAVWFFEFVFLLFFVARPLLNGPVGIPDPVLESFSIKEDAFITYLLCGLLFALLFHPAVCWLYGRRRVFTDHFLRLCDFEHVRKSRFTMVFVGFVVLNYALNVFKFHSLSYVFSSQDSFEAGTRLAAGLWSVEMMSSVLIFPCLVLMAKSLDAKPLRLLSILFLTMAGFVVIVHPTDRTGIIGLLVSVFIYVASTRRSRLGMVRTVAMAIGTGSAVVVLMLLLNDFRMGQIPDAGRQLFLARAFGGLWAGTLPAANGLVLINYLKGHSWLYFRYLLLTLLPSSVIPRPLFPYKPRIDMESILTYNIFGVHLDSIQYHEGSTLCYTVPIAGYADLSYIGVVVAALFYAFFFAAFLRGWKSKAVTVRFMALYYLVLVIAGFRLSIGGLTIISYWILISASLMYFAAHFAGPSLVSSLRVVPLSRDHARTGNWLFAVCALVAFCTACLLGYALTSR